MDPKNERPVKKIGLKHQSSPIDTTKVPPLTYMQKGKKLIIDDDLIWKPSDEVSREKIVVAHGGETLVDRDITE